MDKTIAFQGFLSLRLPKIINNKDYREYEDLLITGYDVSSKTAFLGQALNKRSVPCRLQITG